jgi:hypothetical protein
MCVCVCVCVCVYVCVCQIGANGAPKDEPLIILQGQCMCIEYIGVFSVYNQYNCVYYCDTCYVRIIRS